MICLICSYHIRDSRGVSDDVQIADVNHSYFSLCSQEDGMQPYGLAQPQSAPARLD